MKKPKRQRTSSPTRHTLSYQLREVIESRGLTAYAVARLADVDPGVVSRFMTCARDIRLETADRLAAALGLRLVEIARKGRGRPGRPAQLGAEPAGDEIEAAAGSASGTATELES